MMGQIYVFGDSAGQGLYLDGDGRYRVSRRGCVRLMKKAGYPVANHAVHGYTTREGLAAFRKTETVPGGICVIEFGGNDCDLDWDAVSADPDRFHDGRVPIREFRDNLELFIRLARERGLEPIPVTPIPLMSARYYAWVSRERDAEKILRYLRGDPESISRWQERYANVIREVAQRQGCRLADLRGWMLDELDYPFLICTDGIHPTEEGQERAADAAMRQFPLMAQAV